MKLAGADCSISDIKERDYESMTLYLWSLMDAGILQGMGRQLVLMLEDVIFAPGRGLGPRDTSGIQLDSVYLKQLLSPVRDLGPCLVQTDHTPELSPDRLTNVD